MQQEVLHGPSHALLKVKLDPGETLIAEAGSMVTHSPGLGMEVKLNAGAKAGFFAKLTAFLIAMVRKFIGGDSFFVNHFNGGASGGEVTIAPALNGSIQPRSLGQGESVMLTAGAYLCSTPGVDLQIKWGGIKGMLSKEGAFFVQASGPGELFFNSYGGIQEIEVNGSYIVDNGHIVAFDSNLTYDIRSPGGGLMGAFASGEGLVCEFKGNGKVYIQSRNVSALVDWMSRF